MSAAHFHLALVHVPVLFVPLALLLLAGGLFLKKEAVVQTALIVFVFSSLVAIPVFLTGEPAEALVEELPLVSNAAIEAHEHAAELAFQVTCALGIVALGAFILRTGTQAQKVFLRTTMIIGLLASVTLLRAANLGGQVRHSEIRDESTQEPTLPKVEEESERAP